MLKVTALLVLLYTSVDLGTVDGTLQDKYAELEDTIGELTRQIMMHQFHVEEVIRATANSGLKRLRNYVQGTRSYYSASHVNEKYGPIHDHANTIRGLGWGEFIAVLNGIEFRTRHNDFTLHMKSTTSGDYQAKEEIPFPDVPKEVTDKGTVEEQIVEMREWFKAWSLQDESIRPYKPYFRAVFCVIEGRYTKADPDTIQDPFDTPYHSLDATSWVDLEQKVRFAAYSAMKDPGENYAYFPSIIWGMNGTDPIMAQWNMDIVCHPIERDAPLNRFGAIEDLKNRISMGYTWDEYLHSRAAGFQYGVFDQDQWIDGKAEFTPLDELMREIPGPDNYMGNITDTFLDDIAYRYDTTDKIPVNAAFYNRVYRSEKEGAMGLTLRRRGFNDEFLFVAQTTQEQVMGLPVKFCDEQTGDCKKWFQRWSYAVPMEYTFMTPLTKWNPYNLEYKGDYDSDLGTTVYTGPNGEQSRNGSATPETCFDGINSIEFYMTPAEFFGDEVLPDPADTTRSSVCVLDPQGNMRNVKASGHRIFINDIPGVGILRQRFPCAPWDEEGQGVWKELDALKDMFAYPEKYKWMLKSDPKRNYLPGAQVVTFSTQPSDAKRDFHSHEVKLTNADTANYGTGAIVEVITEEADTHRHLLKIQQQVANGETKHVILSCDGDDVCWDGHPNEIIKME